MSCSSLTWSQVSLLEKRTFLEVCRDDLRRRGRFCSDFTIEYSCSGLEKACREHSLHDAATSVGSDDDVASVIDSCSSVGDESIGRWCDVCDEHSKTSAVPVLPPGNFAVSSSSEQKRRRGTRGGRRGGKAKVSEPEHTAAATTAGPTTLLVSNISKVSSRDALLRMLEELGLKSSCDFLYLPISFKDGLVCGYAFLNFLSHECALLAMEILQGYVPSHARCGLEPLDVAWAKGNQGRESLVNRYRNSPVLLPGVPEEWQPLLFCDGVCVAFPAPTRKVKAVAGLESK